MPLEMPISPPRIPSFAEAIALHQQGRLQEAESCYAQILAGEPGNIAALYHQGLARLQRGDLKGGITNLEQVLQLAPDHVEANSNIGQALLQQGSLKEALPHFQQVCKLAPNDVEGHFYEGLTLAHLGGHAEAVHAFEKALALRPDLAEVHHNLGSALVEIKQHESAVKYFKQALALNPSMAEAHNGLGNALMALQRPEEAAESFKRAIALQPSYAEAHNGLGNALLALERFVEAGESFKRAIALRADYAEAHHGLGSVLNQQGRYDQAAREFKQSILLKPDFELAYMGWGHALQEMGQFKAARACWEKVIELKPEEALAHAGLGLAWKAEGEHTKALASFRHALSLDGEVALVCNGLGSELFDWGRADEGLFYNEKAVKAAPKDITFASGLLFNLHYHPGLSAAEGSARHHTFGENFEAALKPLWSMHSNTPDPEKILRIGFVSGDLRRHPVGYFMADLLTYLKATGLELYAYANQWVNDDLTDRIRPMFTGWRECKLLSDDAMAAQIRADGIDIMVDLSGHTAGGRLLVFARKPAPVQVTYLGYPDTTGLSAIDYILGDPRMFPPGEEGLYVEKPWLLPDTSLCFTPPDLPVGVGPQPASQNGYVNFGCLNKNEKANNNVVIETWAKVLHAVPGSRLLLQNKTYGDEGIATDVRKRYAAHGIGADRLELIGKLSWREHMETYNRVDIALDPFPYNGTTTTIEGLWMGVPLLALKGDRLVAHMGESIMHTMGMTEWIATDKEDYVAKAATLAGDLTCLGNVRANLRNRLLASPICNAPLFARNLETAFRGMWWKWCEQHVN